MASDAARLAMIAVSAVAAVNGPAPALAQPAAADATYEVRFSSLKQDETQYAAAGPVGPFFPEGAIRARMSGEALISCRTAAGGALRGCRPISEQPERSGFSIAACIMASRNRIFVVGEPPEGQVVRVRVPFQLGAPAVVAP